MLCEIFGCRYNNTHNTKNHQCGNCKKYGHGMRGCPLLNYGITLYKLNKLDNFLVNKFIKNKEFLKPSDKNYLKRLIFTELQKNYYSYHTIGMGCGVIIRNNNNIYEYITFDETIYSKLNKENKNLFDLYFIKNFIYGYKKK